MTTTVKAAARWTGEGFDLPDLPAWLGPPVGAGKLTFTPPTMGVETASGSATAAVGDWLLLLEDDTLAVVTDADFTANYEVRA